MFTQILSTKGLRELCPDFSKIAFVLLLFFVGFAAPQVQGQVVVILDDIGLASSETNSQKVDLKFKKDSEPKAYQYSQMDIFPNPFQSQLTIQVSENENLDYLELIDENGTVVWERNVYSIPDKFIIESLDPGTYFLNLSISGGVHTETLIYQP